jgi:hypothetical protein
MALKKTMAEACEAIAKSLREFGYSDATATMVWDCWIAMNGEGKSEDEMPHGIVGRFAYSQLDEHKDWLRKLIQEKP